SGWGELYAEARGRLDLPRDRQGEPLRSAQPVGQGAELLELSGADELPQRSGEVDHRVAHLVGLALQTAEIALEVGQTVKSEARREGPGDERVDGIVEALLLDGIDEHGVEGAEGAPRLGALDRVDPEEQLIEDLALRPVVLDQVQAEPTVETFELAPHPREVRGDVEGERVELLRHLDRLRGGDRLGPQLEHRLDLRGDPLLLGAQG